MSARYWFFLLFVVGYMLGTACWIIAYNRDVKPLSCPEGQIMIRIATGGVGCVEGTKL